MLLAGFALIAAGSMIMGKVIHEWSGNDFGPLAATREVIARTCLVVLGIQTCFGGFLLSIIAGNRARLDELVEDMEAEAAIAAGASRAQGTAGWPWA
jgi:hypothetical protein